MKGLVAAFERERFPGWRWELQGACRCLAPTCSLTVHRHPHHAPPAQGGRLGDVELRKGDVLVLSVGSEFDPKSDDFKTNFKK